MNKMSDLWPDFSNSPVEKNDAIEILREQARLLEKKTDKKVKATFSKIEYKNGAEQLGRIVQHISASISSEVLEDELAEKKDANELYRIVNYKFEIYNSTYRFRVFTLHYKEFYPFYITIDEGIQNELAFASDICIDNNASLKELISSIFSSQKLRTIISRMMLDK